MFSSGPNYTKLKTNIRLALNRLKLLEKKKAELAQKARKEIADYLAGQKTERAKIRVEHIIREDYLVEAMEIVEMYCDLLLARFGLVTQMKELDDGIAEAVASLVWVCPRLQSDVPELKIISEIFIQKYGPQFAECSKTATGSHNVSEKLMHKLQLQAPPKLLVEKYLMAIAKNYNIEYEPDPQIMQENKADNSLIDLYDKNNLNSGGRAEPPQIGFVGYPQIPALPKMPEPPSNKPFNYPPPRGGGGGGGSSSGFNPSNSFTYNIPPTNVKPTNNLQQNIPPEQKDINTNFLNKEKSQGFNIAPESYSADGESPDENILETNKPKPQPRSKMNLSPNAPPHTEIPILPSVPNELPDIPSDANKDDDEIDFDELSRRFENLKKKK